MKAVITGDIINSRKVASALWGFKGYFEGLWKRT
jgi:hypothetical protein